MNFDNAVLDGIDFLIFLLEDQGFSVSNFEFEDNLISFIVSNHGKHIRIECCCNSTSLCSSEEEIQAALEYLKK